MSLFREIHRRSLWQILGVYAVAAWIVFQVAQTLTEGMGLPTWVPPVALVLLLIGLPVVLTTAFLQGGGPTRAGVSGPAPFSDPAGGGPPSETPATSPTTQPAAPTAAHGLFTWRNALIGGVLAFATLGLAGTAWVLLGPGTISARAGGSASGSSDGPKSIAVLPFSSVRTDDENESFRVGIHDALLTQLSKVGDLHVISRTSVLEYQGDHGRSAREIGDELGVESFLEGTIQRADNTILVNVQLIDTETDGHVWAETYTRDLSAVNLIAVQSEMVRDITRALEAALAPAEEARIAEVPTESLEAYDLYLQGRERRRQSGRENVLAAAEMFEEAVSLDPAFALAWAELSYTHSYAFWFGYDWNPERRERARTAADQALSLRPGLPEGHVAMATYYYWGHRDYTAALAELEAAERAGISERAEFYLQRAAVQRRQGNLEAALEDFVRAATLAPRSPARHHAVGQTRAVLGRHADAEAAWDRTAELQRGDVNAYSFSFAAWNRIVWMGDLAGAREWIDRGLGDGMPPRLGIALAFWERRPELVSEYLINEPELIRGQTGETPRSLYLGEAFHRMGQTERARVHFDSSRILLERIRDERPEDELVEMNLSWTYARLGRSDDAVRAAELAVERMSMTRDAWIGPSRIRNLAQTYVTVGRLDDAVEQLELLRSLNPPAWLLLNVDPWWDPLRDHPRFKELAAEEQARWDTARAAYEAGEETP